MPVASTKSTLDRRERAAVSLAETLGAVVVRRQRRPELHLVSYPDGARTACGIDSADWLGIDPRWDFGADRACPACAQRYGTTAEALATGYLAWRTSTRLLRPLHRSPLKEGKK